MAAKSSSTEVKSKATAKSAASTTTKSKAKAESTTTNKSSGNYWLLKSEEEVFSIQDLAKAPKKTTYWDGVRNYQARNFLRDSFKLGDLIFFYHSNSEPSAIAGIAEVVKEGYPDHTAFDPDDVHFDPKSDKAKPTWYMIDVRHVETFKKPLPLELLRQIPGLSEMALLQKGSRLSVQPVTAKEWKIITDLAAKQ
jgi:predicted RNA-binding protein with PUA-like domain